MKAYKLIWELLKRPFADVVTPHHKKIDKFNTFANCDINHIRYNSYYKYILLESIDDGTNKKDSSPSECGKECWYDGGNTFADNYNPCQDCEDGHKRIVIRCKTNSQGNCDDESICHCEGCVNSAEEYLPTCE